MPPAPDEQPVPPRQLYREQMNRRQQMVFGSLFAGLAIALLVASLGMLGLFNLPFATEFSHKVTYAEPGDTVCPTEGAKPVSPAGAQLQVLNASSTGGLANTVSEFLKEQGYEISLVDNAAQPFRGNVQIETGAGGVDHAYTLASYFDAPIRIKYKELPGQTVTIILGEGFVGIPGAEELASMQSGDIEFEPLEGCRPVNPDQQQSSESGGQS